MADAETGIEAALECLRLFDIEISPHPTRGEVEAEYEAVWKNLKERSIESLIDLPSMTDPEVHAERVREVERLGATIVGLMNISGADPRGAIDTYRDKVLPRLRA